MKKGLRWLFSHGLAMAYCVLITVSLACAAIGLMVAVAIAYVVNKIS